MHCTTHDIFRHGFLPTRHGAKHDFFKQRLEGRNTYINPPFNTYVNDEHVITQVIRKVASELRSDRPTRVALLIPIFEGPTGGLYETQAREAKFLEIVSFDKNSFHRNIFPSSQ